MFGLMPQGCLYRFGGCHLKFLHNASFLEDLVTLALATTQVRRKRRMQYAARIPPRSTHNGKWYASCIREYSGKYCGAQHPQHSANRSMAQALMRLRFPNAEIEFGGVNDRLTAKNQELQK